MALTAYRSRGATTVSKLSEHRTEKNENSM